MVFALDGTVEGCAPPAYIACSKTGKVELQCEDEGRCGQCPDRVSGSSKPNKLYTFTRFLWQFCPFPWSKP